MTYRNTYPLLDVLVSVHWHELDYLNGIFMSTKLHLHLACIEVEQTSRLKMSQVIERSNEIKPT